MNIKELIRYGNDLIQSGLVFLSGFLFLLSAVFLDRVIPGIFVKGIFIVGAILLLTGVILALYRLLKENGFI